MKLKIINPKISVGVGLACFAVMAFDYWHQDASELKDMSLLGKIPMVLFCAILLYYVVILFGAMVVNLFRK